MSRRGVLGVRDTCRLLSVDLLLGTQILRLIDEEAKSLGRGLGEERLGLCPMDRISFITIKSIQSPYLMACLLRKALSFAVQGLMMLSEGETYVCFALE